MEETNGWAVLDEILSRPVRTWLEERFWRPIEAQATLEAMRDDPDFLADPGTHPAMFADHGVVHARDVSIGLVRLLDTIDGVLLPARPPARLRFVGALGVAAAYLHDIGMVDMTATGRRVHPQYAAHVAFGPEITPLVDHLLAPGPVRARLDDVAAQAPFAVPLDLVLREMLSLSVTHSKSVVPAAALDDRAALRRLLQRVVFTSLDAHRASPWPSAAHDSPMPAEANVDRYPDPSASFAWLTAVDGPQAELADDVVDAMRALRAADVLRQRGSVLRTSGGFEVCMDADTARAVCTLRPATGDAAYVIAYDDERGAGEANIRVAFVTPRGHLRIAFNRGSFGSPEATRRAASSVAGVVIDIQADVIPSFSGSSYGGGLPAPTRRIEDVQIQLERPDDHHAFAEEVVAIVARLEPSLAPRLVTVANVEGAAPAERRRFYESEPVDPFGADADELLRRLAEHGVETSGIDRLTAFSEVGRTTLRRGEVLVAQGSPPSFVYVPTGRGLTVLPHGGYAPSPLAPWVPVGTTGVIRRAERNSEIVAEREVGVIAIPGDLYARAWLRPLRVDELATRLRPPVASA
jgi:hypothetical protein